MNRNYDKNYCWQYHIRLQNREEDMFFSGLTEETVKNLTVHDFDFNIVSTDSEKKQCIDFIKRHEWLGDISQFTTHWFTCTYKGILSGVILMNMPNSFSKLLGEETKYIERLISRGACISWSPKNLASHFLMWCINYMVQNTQYRVFTAYSDESALEIGQIYQACNFYYLGKNSGASFNYINPFNTKKVMTDRAFRSRSFYKKYAKCLGIVWQKNWNNDQKILWENIPNDIEQQLRQYGKDLQAKSQKIEIGSKHKYAYVLGKDKKESKLLRRKFLELNKVYTPPKRNETFK